MEQCGFSETPTQPAVLGKLGMRGKKLSDMDRSKMELSFLPRGFFPK